MPPFSKSEAPKPKVNVSRFGSKPQSLAAVGLQHVGRSRAIERAGRKLRGKIGPAPQQRFDVLGLVGLQIENGEIGMRLRRRGDAALVRAEERLDARLKRRGLRFGVSAAAGLTRSDAAGGQNAACTDQKISSRTLHR